MREIGGYFEFESLRSDPYHTGAISLNSGRNGLKYLIHSRKIEKIYLPYFLCDSVIDTVRNERCEIVFYHIDRRLRPILPKALLEADGAFLYVVNYYGQIQQKEIKHLKSTYSNIVVDNVQAFFQRPVAGVDTIYSCRKFFGVPDGAYLFTDAASAEELPYDHSGDRLRHLLGRFEDSAPAYYAAYQENEARIDRLPLRRMSRYTASIMGAVDYQGACEKRTQNYRFLRHALSMLNELETADTEGAFAYPLLLPNGEQLRAFLTEQGIYTAQLWPNVRNDTDVRWLENQLARDIIPLPCDQRYSRQDMEYIVNAIQKRIQGG